MDMFTVLAGKKALAIIKDKGFCADDVKVMAGAAGGPKWLVLSGLDRLLFGKFFADRKIPLELIGSSIGAWRFAAAALTGKNDSNGTEAFKAAYVTQSYSSRPTPAEVSTECVRIMNTFLDDKGVLSILKHPFLRLNLFAARCKHLVASENKLVLGLGLAGSAIANMIDRQFLHYFYKRTLFFNPVAKPTFADLSQFDTDMVALTSRNLRQALLASGSIPMVMQGSNEIYGAFPGIYRDGGIIDYHMDLPFLPNPQTDTDLVLLPHYTDRIVPGWFDKALKWRKPAPANMDRVVLVAPSKAFIEKLPLNKIPDRKDFQLFLNKDQERIDYWNKAIQASDQLAMSFLESIESGKIRQIVSPMQDRDMA